MILRKYNFKENQWYYRREMINPENILDPFKRLFATK